MRYRTSRSTVLAAIAVVHAAAIALALSVRGPDREEELQQPMAVSLLTESHSEPPAPRLRDPEVVMPAVVIPLISIDIPQEAPPPPITLASPAPQTTPASSSPVPGGDTSQPIVVSAVEYVRAPVVSYPAAARQARASGTAHIRAVVETDGRVREASVERSSGYASLDKAARESVLGALFRPYMHDGVARAALVIVPVEFSLKVRGGRR